MAPNEDVDLKKYLGPIMWDIEVGDCGIGDRRDGTLWTLEMCQQAYLERIESAGKGVVLLHDSAADPGDRGVNLRANNRTHELVRWLAPEFEIISSAWGSMTSFNRVSLLFDRIRLSEAMGNRIA